MKRVLSWAWATTHDVFVALDYGLCLLLWLRVEAPMTISSRCGLALRAGKRWTVLALLGRLLDLVSPGHCSSAITADIQRAERAKALLTKT